MTFTDFTNWLASVLAVAVLVMIAVKFGDAPQPSSYYVFDSQLVTDHGAQ